MRGVIWPEFFLRIDYLLHHLSKNVYARSTGMEDRAIERPFVFQNLPPPGDVLDVGCTGSDLPVVLTGLGYRVTGLDARPYGIPDPPFRFVQGDIRATGLPAGSFDIVTAVSTVEHIGLAGRYDMEDADPAGDRHAVEEFRRVLRPQGTLLLTVPYGKPAILRPWHRVYGPDELARLVEGFERRKAQFFRPDDRGIYRLVDQPTASAYAPRTQVEKGRLLDYSYGLACLVLTRP